MLASASSRDGLGAVWRGSEKLRYVALGVWNTVFAYLAFFGLYGLFHRHLHYLVISVLAHVLAVSNAFVCQRVFVFRSTAAWGASFARFCVVQFGLLTASLLAIGLLVELAKLPPLAAQLIVMTAGVIAGYLLNRHFSFKSGRP